MRASLTGYTDKTCPHVQIPCPCLRQMGEVDDLVSNARSKSEPKCTRASYNLRILEAWQLEAFRFLFQCFLKGPWYQNLAPSPSLERRPKQAKAKLQPRPPFRRAAFITLRTDRLVGALVPTILPRREQPRNRTLSRPCSHHAVR